MSKFRAMQICIHILRTPLKNSIILQAQAKTGQDNCLTFGKRLLEGSTGSLSCGQGT